MTHAQDIGFFSKAACFCAGVLLLATAPGEGQTLRIGFAAPTADMVSSFGADHVSGLGLNGYRSAWIDASNVAVFRTMAPSNIERTWDALQPGTDLRRNLDRAMQISQGRVDVDLILVDDSGGLNGSEAVNGGCSTESDSGNLYVWPAAGSSPAGDRWRAKICIGEWSSAHIQAHFPGGWQAWESTILHETFHTQFVGEFSKWGVVSNRLITYGFDGSHWTSEIMGEQALPFEEGFGTFLGDLLNPAGRAETVAFFTRTGHRYALEGRSVSAGYERLYNAPRERREIDVIAPDGSTIRETVWQYRWRDVPGFYLMFSESTSMAYHHFIWDKVNSNHDQALEMIFNEVGAMWQSRLQRFLTYGANRLALQLEAFAATPEGQAARSAGTLTSSMFPYALLDLLLHFGMDENEFRADHDRHYPDRNPRAYTEYWLHRDAVQRLAQPHLDADPIEIEQAVDAIHTYFTQADRILQARLDTDVGLPDVGLPEPLPATEVAP